MSKPFFILFLLVTACCNRASTPIDIRIACNDHNQLMVDYRISGSVPVDSILLYRSYQDLNKFEHLNCYEQPITKIVIKDTSLENRYVDSFVANNCDYYYYMKAQFSDGSKRFSNVVSCYVNDLIVVTQVDEEPVIFIDKINYYLEIRNGSAVVKRYPVSLGSNPFNRKLHYDCRSTPEGIYNIKFIKRQSDFHKSIGVNYPNVEDRKRYEKARNDGKLPIVNGGVPHIGGSITIHGGGIGNNWTWGCIAMRNSDLDEIFSVVQLHTKTPILICGSEVRRDDLK